MNFGFFNRQNLENKNKNAIFLYHVPIGSKHNKRMHNFLK
jgi:hypothetical protein